MHKRSCNVTTLPTWESEPSVYGAEEEDTRGAHEVAAK